MLFFYISSRLNKYNTLGNLRNANFFFCRFVTAPNLHKTIQAMWWAAPAASAKINDEAEDDGPAKLSLDRALNLLFKILTTCKVLHAEFQNWFDLIAGIQIHVQDSKCVNVLLSFSSII